MFNDCRGNAHGTNEERHDADVAIVEEVLNKVSESVDDYTRNSDYAYDYLHIVEDMSPDWAEAAKDYIRSAFEGCDNYDDHADLSDQIVDHVHHKLEGSFDSDPEYNPCEYAAYSGPGLCLYQLDIGEYEEQTDISAFKELQTLHDAGILDDILDDVNCTCYVLRQCRREKNDTDGRYEDVGRETYGPTDKYPCLMTYHCPGGQWMWVVPEKRIDDMIQEAIGAIA